MNYKFHICRNRNDLRILCKKLIVRHVRFPIQIRNGVVRKKEKKIKNKMLNDSKIKIWTIQKYILFKYEKL